MKVNSNTIVGGAMVVGGALLILYGFKHLKK